MRRGAPGTLARPGFEEFADRNPQLLDSGLLGQFYSPGLLASGRARSQRVTPDLHALPVLAAADA